MLWCGVFGPILLEVVPLTQSDADGVKKDPRNLSEASQEPRMPLVSLIQCLDSAAQGIDRLQRSIFPCENPFHPQIANKEQPCWGHVRLGVCLFRIVSVVVPCEACEGMDLDSIALRDMT